MSLEPGQILDGKYRVGRLIGEGGMGTVYEGENSRIGRRVAIKVLHAQVAAMPEFVERFEREARASARIGSPHVCDVLDLGDLPNGDRYIIMEYLDGISFEDRILERGKMTAAQLAPIAFELLEGLGTMHVARVIHRDLKPANVFLARTPSGRGEIVKILDFGVAKLQPFEGEVATMTQTGTLMGTPLYMSPEQARGARDVDGRTDIYAASVMFYRALAGVLPYTADTLNELLFKIVLEDPKPLRDHAPEVDEVFAELVHKGLSRDVEQRFQTAREYQEAIARWGKTQGRTSLAFSVTMVSEPPGPSSAPPEVPAMPAPKAVTRPNDGTPTAWSEDGPEDAKRAASTPKLAAASPAAGAPVEGRTSRGTGDPAAPRLIAPGGGGAASEVSASASTVAMKSEPPSSGPWAEGAEVAPADAITSPNGAAVDLPAPTPKTVPHASGRRSRTLALSLGAAGALALAAFFAFGRGGAPQPAASSIGAATATGASSPASTAATAPLDTPVPKESTVTPLLTDASVVPTERAAAASPASAAHREPLANGARRSEPRPAASPTVAVASAAPVSVAPTATAPTKPAGSAARKFRTNLD